MKPQTPIIHPIAFPFGRPRGFKSVEEALASVGDDPRRTRSNADGKHLEGSAVRDFWFSRNEAGLVFSNGMAIRAQLGEADLNWLVAPEKEFVRLAPDDLGDLTWMQWNEDRPAVAWDRVGPFQRRIGGRFKMLDVADYEVRVYLHGFDILIFHALGDREREDVFLHWYEDD